MRSPTPGNHEIFIDNNQITPAIFNVNFRSVLSLDSQKNLLIRYALHFDLRHVFDLRSREPFRGIFFESVSLFDQTRSAVGSNGEVEDGFTPSNDISAQYEDHIH